MSHTEPWSRRFRLREYRAYEHFGKGVWACYEEA